MCVNVCVFCLDYAGSTIVELVQQVSSSEEGEAGGELVLQQTSVTHGLSC